LIQIAIEYWKRKEVLKAMEWGMLDYEVGKELGREVERPMFEGEIITSVIDGKQQKYFSERFRYQKH
jgi:hypothetical protein